ncbi:MAG: hypothetical protein KKA63_01730, partial [Gammaproteobacteria bacterium]|nr:hypothetical protein [Gammaproteobacteria bacterium]
MKKSRLARIGFAAIALTSSSVSFGLAENEDTRKEALVEYSKSARAACIKDKPCFMISNKYPNELPPDATSTPWSSIDYKLNPEAYLTAVLKYVVEGNLEVDWEIDKNKVRKWYHAPWMHNQREPIRGLTRERGSRWHELSVSQTRRTNNWAVGFYNVAGGYAFGNAWKDNAHPNSLNAIFPVGTVSAKLLF